MKLKSLFALKSNIIKPCSKLLSEFSKLKPSKTRKRSSIKPRIRLKKSLGFSQCRKLRPKKIFRVGRKKSPKPVTKSAPKVRVAEYLTILFSLRKAKDIEEGGDNPVMSDATIVAKGPAPSPNTPLFARHSDATNEETSEESCRSFENYLVEMIVEQGKLTDLMDVEELLYCWRNLKSPIFIDLVCNFYGELCKDLFSPSQEVEGNESSTSL